MKRKNIIQKHVRSNATKKITNGEIEGENCCNITLQNPERVKSKGRQKQKKGRRQTIVESAKMKAKKKNQKKQKGDTTPAKTKARKKGK